MRGMRSALAYPTALCSWQHSDFCLQSLSWCLMLTAGGDYLPLSHVPAVWAYPHGRPVDCWLCEYLLVLLQAVWLALSLVAVSLSCVLVSPSLCRACTQGFLPEDWDAFVQYSLYPSYTPTVLTFLAGSTVYGLWKVGRLPLPFMGSSPPPPQDPPGQK
jgi:hypothetical protein